jgi:hypothetical protein
MGYPDIAHDNGKARLRPYTAWPRCTRWISYKQTRSESGERVVGSWRFRSDWLAEKLIIGAAASYVEHYLDETLICWLRDRNNADERVTALPDNWNIVALYLLLYVENGDCRPFCMTCGRNIAHADLSLENTGGPKGDRGKVVRCDRGHVLLDQRCLIHID